MLLLAGVLVVAGTGTAAVVGARPDPVAGRVPAALSTSANGADVAARTVAGPAGAGAGATVPATALVRSRAVTPLLTARAAAARTGNRAGWTAGLDPSATALRAEQRQVLDRIRRLAPTSWRYELVGTEDLAPAASPGAERPGDAGAFLAHVRLRYRLSGDTRDVVREQYLPVVRRSGRWYLGAGGDPRTEPALWDLGELTVRRARRVLVVGVGDPARVDPTVRRAAALADAAAGDVDAVWGTGWPRRAVLVVPDTRRRMAEILGRADDASLDQVAAVTSGELDRVTGVPSAAARGGVADRVVLNPGPFARLSDVGRRVVLTHELTHVATRATTRLAAPLWVEEGFANYVAYRAARLDRAVVAADVLPLVRAGTASHGLPDATAFDPARGPIAAAYADAWLAFDLMARAGATRPVRFYRAAVGLDDLPAGSVDQALAQAFRTVLGTSQDRFELQWRAYRAQLAGVPSAR